MTQQVVNFNAGPAGLPRAVMERARDEFLDFEGTGISVMEHSHRGKAYEGVHHAAMSLTKELLDVPSSHEVLFLQGGASQCFATVPMNFLPATKSADYVVTGAWSKKALKEAQVIGKARSAGSGEVDGKFIRIPKQSDLDLDASAAYCHITSNNTIAGTQFQMFPKTGNVPLVADMSSDIFWKKIDVSKFKLIYAGAQKNIGPSGVTLLILDKAWAAEARKDIPQIFQFQTHIEAESLYNTPPTFGIYMAKLVLEHLKNSGGLEGAEKRNHEKARLLYQAIDNSGGFYACPVERDARSFMNVVFRLPSEALEKSFVDQATKDGMIGLKGHRSVGGCRASIYNAVTIEGAQRLASFMDEFAKKNG